MAVELLTVLTIIFKGVNTSPSISGDT